MQSKIRWLHRKNPNKEAKNEGDSNILSRIFPLKKSQKK